MSTPSAQAGVAAVIVLAAGAGTRMRSTTSKLLHTIGGRSLLSYAVDAAAALAPQHLVVVVGHQRDQVEAHLAEIAPGVLTAVQEAPRGTGDAVRSGLLAVPDVTGEVVVTYGDVPLLTGDTLQALVAAHRAAGDSVTVLTTILDEPGAYGRVVRDDGGEIERIVEAKDATPEEASLTEINAGIYVFDADVLRAGLASLTTDNVQGELYLTDVVGFARARGGRVHPMVLADRWQAEGVNDRTQLATLGRIKNERLCEAFMMAGVTIVDPASTWIEDGVDIRADVTLLPGTQLQGATTIESGAIVGPETTLIDAEVGAGARVTRTTGQLTVIGAGAKVGPYVHLRPGTEIGDGARIGSFVELRAAHVAAGEVVEALTVRDEHVHQDS